MRIPLAAALALIVAVGVASCGQKTSMFPNCGDNVRNGEETDIDCGGRICTPCNTAKHCAADSDCRSKLCNSDGVCSAATCDDGVFNGSESARDCGAPDCAPCSNDRICAGDNDCVSRVCTGGTCQAPSCHD